MSGIINTKEIPKEDIVYVKRDFFGYRVVEPIRDPKTKRVIWKNLFSKKGFLMLGVLLIILASLYLAFREQLANYRYVLGHPCELCNQILNRTIIINPLLK